MIQKALNHSSCIFSLWCSVLMMGIELRSLLLQMFPVTDQHFLLEESFTTTESYGNFCWPRVNKKEKSEFKLKKYTVINGENACYKAPRFSKPHIRTRNAIIDDMLNNLKQKKTAGKARKGSLATQSTNSSVGSVLSTGEAVNENESLSKWY